MSLKYLTLFLTSCAFATIDLNFAELEYLADHLLPEECRRLVAAAHFKSYMMPNNLDQAEQTIPKDIPCIEHLLHWNSAEGEGRGETHEVLEHRLRQMGKHDLADWLGKTVFHQLGKDLEDSLQSGLKDVANETSQTEKNISMPTLMPVIEITDPTEWLPIDSILLALLVGLILILIGLCCFLLCRKCSQKCKNAKKKKLEKSGDYQMLAHDVSDMESEDKFDIRQHETPM